MTPSPGHSDHEYPTTAARRSARVERRERVAEALFGAGFLAAATAFLLLVGAPAADVHAVSALACIACLAIAAHVPFAIGGGYTVPTQLAFVPLLFTLPPGLVPFAVVLAIVLARAPGVVAGRTPASRFLLVPGDAWFALGPAAVLALADVHAVADLTLPVLAAALISQVLVETVAWLVREALLGRATLRLEPTDLWVNGVDLALTPIALLTALDLEARPWTVFTLVPLLGVLAVFSREREGRLAGVVELKQAYRGTALVLGDVVEADDGYTGEHSRGVVERAVEVGDALGLDDEQRRNLEFAALLHDVGKVVIPKAIINKPGSLNEAEWEIVRSHPAEGQRILNRVGGLMRDVGVIVRAHHERWDGGGYPDGLAGEAIPLEARIIAACDAWNAMTTQRPYRAPLPAHEAVAELRRGAGAQFDPRVVDALLAILAVPEPPVALVV